MRKPAKTRCIKAMRIMLISLALLILASCGNADGGGAADAPDSASTEFADSGTVLVEDILPDVSTPGDTETPEIDSIADDSVSGNAAAPGNGSSETDNAGTAVAPDAVSNADPDSYIDDIEWITENDKQTTFGTVVVAGDSVNVRAGSGIETGILGRVREGTILALLQSGEENGFYKVSYVGNPAYISSDFSLLTSGEGVNVISSGEKLIALTFDDGPNSTQTPLLLDILKAQGVYATFFVLGASARTHPDIVRRAAEDGHEIGSHAWSHADLTTLSAGSLISELVNTANAIEEITGSRPLVTRPPFGAYNDAVLEAIETPVIMWSVDPMDWRFRDADTVYQNVINVAKDGDIILLHDVHNTSVQAAERIVAEFKARGFTFVTVSELIARRGSASQVVYTALRP